MDKRALGVNAIAEAEERLAAAAEERLAAAAG